MAITAKMVKELREKTGVGMMDCKKALAETDGNVEAAVDWLRKKGLSTASKKSGRVAAEGKVAAASTGTTGALIEINSETDFTAKNENFVGFVESCVGLVVESKPADMDAFKALPFPGTERNVGDQLTHMIATIGENMNLRRLEVMSVENGVVSSYIHMGGKIGVLVALESSVSDTNALDELGKKVAMHVAASAPQFLDRNAVSSEALEREKAVLSDQARASGKPENIIEKMVTGRLNKYYGEVCLMEQAFIMDTDQKVGKFIQQAGKDLGAEVTVKGFVRYQLGEGIEKRQENFAEEVTKQMS
ncbi:MAG: elongation factor Ts [Magnetococcales bacterium]|nr:elongation factor Ts [Magnetococcales bacterium]